jgi:hypothetical protein
MHVSEVDSLIADLKKGPVDFNKVVQVIDKEYVFTPSRFTNGHAVNEAGSNNGSCKILAFARLHGLDEQATLNAFGDYYTQDVLQHPEKEDHQNIRQFMHFGWDAVAFDSEPLQAKSR